MLSILIPIRNARELAVWALRSTADAVRTLGLERSCEFILIDDASDAACGIAGLIRSFAGTGTAAPVRGFRLKSRRHYTYAVALGMSVAAGDRVLMVSHDMIVPPAYLRVLLGVADARPDAGVIRGTSTYVDGFPQHVVAPPQGVTHLPEMVRFADQIEQEHGLATVADEFLIGDSMLITRDAIDRVGVFDTGYVGFMGDVDFGLRVQLAGLKLICAKGAWLYHVGSGMVRSDSESGRVDRENLARLHRGMIDTAYGRFREKWDPTLPATIEVDKLPFEKLRTAKVPEGGEYCPPVRIDPGIVEEVSGP